MTTPASRERGRCWAGFTASRWGARAEALEQALVYARRAGDIEESVALGGLPLTFLGSDANPRGGRALS